MILDIGLGLLLAIIAGELFAVELSASLVAWAVFFSLLPDIDYIIYIIKNKSLGGKWAHEHRKLLHHPLLYVVVALFLWWQVGAVWGFLFGAGTLLHLLHDTMGIGSGIRWLVPFDWRYYKLFTTQDNAFSWGSMAVWTEEELREVAEEHGDDDWVRNFFSFNLNFVIEVAALVVALLLLWFIL